MRAHADWKSFKEIFGKERRIDLLNEVAPGVFNVIQFSLLGGVVLALSRLADKRRDALSLEKLTRRFEGCSIALDLLADLKRLEGEFKIRCKPIQEFRHIHLAHIKYEEIVQENVSSVAWPSRREIDSAVGILTSYLNTAYSHLENSEIAFDMFIMRGTGDDLIEFLKRGLRYRQLWREGVIELHDIRKSPWYDA